MVWGKVESGKSVSVLKKWCLAAGACFGAERAASPIWD